MAAPAVDKELSKGLRIKFGMAKRQVKDVAMYQKEVEQQAAKIAKMVEEKADEYDIKQQKKVLAESESMLPDCRRRLEASVATLAEFLETNGDKLKGDANHEPALALVEAQSKKDLGEAKAAEEEEEPL